MAESRYCSEADLRALVPDVYRDASLADSFGGANADPGMLDLVLSSACDEVDALISGRVRLPLPADAIPSKLRTAAALFAAETLCIRRGAIMPEALAAKVKWWRDWLSKIGEGDLRLAATPESDDEAGKSSAYLPAAITARPAITGSRGLLGAIALLLGAVLLPGIARAAVGHRTFSLAVPPDPATFSSVPAIVWERGESVTLELSGATLAPGQHPSWQVADPTNLWMAVESDGFSFHADPATAAIPPGRYAGRVVVTNADASLVRVLAVQDIRVLPGAPNLPPPAAYTPATTDWVAALLESATNALSAADAANAEGIAANAAAVAALENATNALSGVLEDYGLALAALQGATNWLSADKAGTDWVEWYVATYAPQPDLAPYATKDWVQGRGYLTEHQSLADYATHAYVDNSVSNLATAVEAMGSSTNAAEFLAALTNVTSGVAAAQEAANNNGLAIAALQGRMGTAETNVEALSAATNNLSGRTGALEGATNNLAGRVATNEGAISDLRGATNALDGALGALRSDLAATSNAIPSVAGLASEEWVAGYVAENSPPPDLTPYVVKTNGAWVICQGTAWNGIEWDGKRIFGAVLEVGTNGTAEITGLEVAATNRLVLPFRGAATNALEACADMTNWTVWADCGWEYEGETWGRVTVSNASPAYWYRVAALGAVPAWSNAAVVSYAPLYAGSVAASNRVATMADVERKAGASPRGGMAGYMRSTARETSMTPGEEGTNVLWSFTSGESYVKDLTVGGKVVEWDEVEEEGGTTVTNRHSTTNAGSMTLNGQKINGWADIAQYAAGAEVTVVTGVETLNGLDGALSIAGGTNASVRTEGGTVYVDVEGSGVASINGLAGNFLIVNGPGISVATNTMAGFQVVTISATGGGGGGGGGAVDTNAIVSAALAAAGTNDWQSWTIGGVTRNGWPSGGTFEPAWRVVTETNATALATDYLVWLDGSTTGANLGSDDEMVLDLPDMASESQTIVVRRLGNTGEVKVRRVFNNLTNTYLLGSDGSALAADWLGARTNWYWRQAY